MIYKLTDKFPSSEKFGLISQMRRAAVSIASNIAEGAARNSSAEKIQFFTVARGSISELDTQLEISKKLGLISDNEKTHNKVEEVGLLLYGLIASRRRML
ncbi:MAG: four helix bundle protein [Elusimicrobia bacterium]|nr:four helix bundle protein [Elusimicrobiota bacterium]